MSFGTKFRILREAKGMPQAGCDEVFNLMRGTVSNWENGYADPEEELLPDIAGDLVAGIHDGGIMLAAEGFAYIGIGYVGQRAAKIHRHVAGDGYALIAPCGDQLLHGDVEIIGRDLLDQLGRDHVLALGGDVIFKHHLDEAAVDGGAL